MRFLVCVKLAVDVALVRADANGQPNLDVPWRIAPFDENAVELGATLAERHGGTVTALALVSEEPPRDLVLRLLAAGVDEATLVIDREWAEADALVKADVLAAAARELAPDLLLCGEASADRYDAQIGPRLAEALQWPCAAWCTRLALDGRTMIADRALDDVIETVSADLPAVATVGQEMNEPRLPSVLQILAAGRKPVERWTRERLTVPERRCTVTLGVAAPPQLRRGLRLDAREKGPEAIATRLLEDLGRDGLLGDL